MTVYTIAPSTGSGTKEFFQGFPTGMTITTLRQKDLLTTATAVIAKLQRVVDPLASVIGTLLERDPGAIAVQNRLRGTIAAGLLERRPLTPQSEHLSRCFDEVTRVLGASLAQATAAAGIDRGTVYAWRRRGSDPRPGTVGAVLRLHGLVASAAAAVGEEHTRAWFRAGDPSPLDMLIDARGNAAALTAVSRLLRRDVTGPALPAPNLGRAATVDDGPPLPIR